MSLLGLGKGVCWPQESAVEGQAVVEEIQASGGVAAFVKTDVTDEAQVRHLVDETVRQFGGLNIAFNNAGLKQTGTLTELCEVDDRQVFNINVLGVFLRRWCDDGLAIARAT